MFWCHWIQLSLFFWYFEHVMLNNYRDGIWLKINHELIPPLVNKYVRLSEGFLNTKKSWNTREDIYYSSLSCTGDTLSGQYMQCVYISTFIVLNMYVISEIHGIHNRVFFSLCFNTFLIHVRFYWILNFLVFYSF